MTQVARPARSESGGLAARVRLGKIFAPVSVEFLLIASTALILTIFGVVMVVSATSATEVGTMDTAVKQGIFAVIGIPLMFVVSRFPVSLLKKIAWPALIGAVVLQLLVFTPLGTEGGGNRNWISLPGVGSLQPSEFLKLSLLLWIAAVLARKHAKINTWHQVFIPVVPVGVVAIGTVIAGSDLGTAMVLVLILLGCLFFAGVKLRLFILPLIGGAAAVLFYALTSENRMKRITTVCTDIATMPRDIYEGECYQAVHGMWGMASGGVFGLGLGNSQEKYGWLSAAANDFIFAIIGEELGLIGCLVVLALFVCFAFAAFHIIRKTDDPFVRVAAGGISVWILGQALINIGVVIGVFPVMGVPLPFISQGGTSLIAVLLACGVLLSFARTLPARSAEKTPQKQRKRP